MIPYDATQHIQGISQGVNNAMPSLIKAGEAKQAGNPDLEGYINNKFAEFERRVLAGEDPKKVTEEALADFEQTMRGGGVAPGNVPNVGFNNGTPAVGGAGSPPMNPVAQAPNSFNGTGMLNSFANPAPTPSGGITGNVGAPVANMPDSIQATNDTRVIPENITPKTVQVPMQSQAATVKETTPIPYPSGMPPKDSIDLTTRPNPMQTGHGSPVPPMRTRGEQETALSDIERMSKIDNADSGLKFKQDKLELESRIKILKAMSNRLSDQEKMDLMRTLKSEGMTLQAQIAVMDATIRMKNAEDSNKTRQEANRIKADKVNMQIPPELKVAQANYQKVAERIAKLRGTGLANQQADAVGRMFMEEVQTRKTYNELVTKYNEEHGTNYPLIKDEAMAMKDILSGFGSEE